ncbi:MAG: hypothetical protein LBB58_01060 [Cellulomonadaceae bacterium]|jgi:hypothetical protein|nr:hypothetical protein [Cellulomonadaceae bacterium]
MVAYPKLPKRADVRAAQLGAATEVRPGFDNPAAKKARKSPWLGFRTQVAAVLGSVLAVGALTGSTLALWNTTAPIVFSAETAATITSGELTLDLGKAGAVEYDGLVATQTFTGTLTREGDNLVAQLAVTVAVPEGISDVSATLLVEPFPAVEPVETPAVEPVETTPPAVEPVPPVVEPVPPVVEPVETTPPVVEPVSVAALPVPSWPSVESASGLSARSAPVTETTAVATVTTDPLVEPVPPVVEPVETTTKTFTFELPPSIARTQAVTLAISATIAGETTNDWDMDDRADRHAAYLYRLYNPIEIEIEIPVEIALQQVRPEPAGWSDTFSPIIVVEHNEPKTTGQFEITAAISVDDERVPDEDVADYVIAELSLASNHDHNNSERAELQLEITPAFSDLLFEASHAVALGIQVNVTDFDDLLGEGVGLFFESANNSANNEPGAEIPALAEATVRAYWVETLEQCAWSAAGINGVPLTANTLNGLGADIEDEELVTPTSDNGTLTLCLIFAGFGYQQTQYENIATVRAVSPLGAIVMHSDAWQGTFWAPPQQSLETDYYTTYLTFSWKAGLQ